MTLNEAAELLRIDAVEIQQLAERSELPARRIGASWRFNCAAVMAWLNGNWALIAAATPPTIDPLSLISPNAAAPRSSLTTADLAAVTATGTTGDQNERTAQANVPAPAGDPDQPIGEAPEEKTAEDVFLRGQRVLLGRGESTLDFGQFYSKNDSQLLASVDGLTGLATVESEALLTTFQARIGVGDETELFAGTTYFNQTSASYFGSEKIADFDRSEFGNVILGARHTLMKEGPGRPNIIASVNANIPTGDTSYGIGAGLVFVKSIDPVVLFAGINYTHLQRGLRRHYAAGTGGQDRCELWLCVGAQRHGGAQYVAVR